MTLSTSAPKLLFDINLLEMSDEYLTGDWCVADRVLNRNDPNSPLATATKFSLQPGTLRVQASDAENAGKWSMERDSLLNRPYLELQLMQEQTRALITRLRRSTDGLQSQLILYFQSGMEIQLARPC
ncbi:hypothetical protein J0X19_19545 [Hymenobacter sp. BT186]|uniref:Uncharacterized protein n=1 Tax=Hymenobacter telluris TaxID=2816474 RepID=A0A939EZ43_9BACT|nr:hypothetical protein [Hymenobacter telluris]MBO0360165.1 hypothetical protein [Hymenobacter telluris]MBW3376192.1 hypothetical protein [Hymenobacter norwichensis]